MFYIILSILLSVILLIIFKLFEKYGVNTFHAIIINYFTATATGITFSGNNFSPHEAMHSEWFWVCFPLGILLISVFRLISITAQKINVSTAAIANKMSVIIPVIFSVLVLNEFIGPGKISGIVLALIALYFTGVAQKNKSNSESNLFYLPLLVFMGSGLIDLIINATNAFLIRGPKDSEMFTTFSFAVAGFLGILILIFQYSNHKKTNTNKVFFEWKSVIGGVILGIPNYFSIFFILKSLESNLFTSAQLFPILNISNVLLASLSGWLLFREKLTLKNYLGILLAVIAIVLIAI